ncbi:unnamed protein product [Tuber melanosporum]|uniref:(Perigord truffle) hypothetical protein n=1 Tax=Tuber melanosporum (strain Mel28) TaxID=656061 RepID=D5GKM1_TUBMM|nr:uncharacterized protein GSTUM_00009638001 [Tuber melanosporum]CAZ85064.1 unnamed protein product [Tuber melanosporum]
MSTPVHGIPQPTCPNIQVTANTPGRPPPPHVGGCSSENEVFASENPPEPQKRASNISDGEEICPPPTRREENYRLEDDLELLRAERVVSRASEHTGDLSRSKSGRHRSRPRTPEPVDDFDINTNPAHDGGKGVWRPPERPATRFGKVLKAVHGSSVLVRYFTYIVPLVLILLIPLLLGALVFREATVGDVYLMWFMVWLEIVWLSLWAGRILAKCVPYVMDIISGAFTNNSRKWKDMGCMLEVPATLFFWWLAVYVSFLPTMTNHHNDGDNRTRYWESRASIVLLALFIAMILNLFEKIIIQLIAISFHQRTYEDRIDLNKFQISSLAKLYAHSKEVAGGRDLDEKQGSGLTSGAKTPLVVFQHAKAGAHSAFTKVGDVMGKVAGDFTGRQVSSSTSPQQVVLTLLYTTEGSQALARRLFRTLVREGTEVVSAEDLRHVFTSEEEAEAAFQMFDRDLNGDISCEEMEIACVEIGRERKAITASLKDLDSVVSKLDDVFTFLVTVAVILIFLSLISKSTAGVLTSASSSVLALSWLFSATAQEFLASIIFVFVKHPFDVGDRVDVYNTGAGTVDTFFVKEIALMYTEFKKLEGHVVQAPNSLLNTLFILNMRRSGALAEAIPIVCKFGTSLEQIEELQERLLAFVKFENREYQGKVITELSRDVPDMHSVKLNVVFFYKSNWQNELVRLQRRNKFMCALMVSAADLGIESPNMRWPGQKQTSPVFLQSVNADQIQQSVLDRDGGPSGKGGEYRTFAPPAEPHGILRSESRAGLGRSASRGSTKKVDFSLGVKDIAPSDDSGDVFEDNRRNIPAIQLMRVLEEEEGQERRDALSRTTSRDSSIDRNPGMGGAVNRRRSGSGSIASYGNRFFGGRSRNSIDLEGGEGPSSPVRWTSRGGSARDSIEMGRM